MLPSSRRSSCATPSPHSSGFGKPTKPGADYRNFEAVVERARTACFNSGVPVADHFGEVTDMILIGKGGQRPVKTVMMSRYACYLVIQNADPAKAIVAIGQSYFAIQTRRQELAQTCEVVGDLFGADGLQPVGPADYGITHSITLLRG